MTRPKRNSQATITKTQAKKNKSHHRLALRVSSTCPSLWKHNQTLNLTSLNPWNQTNKALPLWARLLYWGWAMQCGWTLVDSLAVVSANDRWSQSARMPLHSDKWPADWNSLTARSDASPENITEKNAKRMSQWTDGRWGEQRGSSQTQSVTVQRSLSTANFWPETLFSHDWYNNTDLCPNTPHATKYIQHKHTVDSVSEN